MIPNAKHRLMAKLGRPLNSRSSGTYVCVLPDTDSGKRLARISAVLGQPLSREQVDDLHSTVIYAKGTFPKDTRFPRSMFGAKISGLEFWSGHDGDGYVVATLDSPDLVAENQRWASRGLSHSFDDYNPHVTLFSGLDKTQELMDKINATSPRVAGMLLTFDKIQLEGLKEHA